MKSWLLPLTTTLGAVSAFALMLATQATPAQENGTEADQQIQRMEHRSRLREWSQGIGVDLSGGPIVVRAQTVGAPETGVPRTSDRRHAPARSADGEKRHERGNENDRDRGNGHEENDEASS